MKEADHAPLQWTGALTRLAEGRALDMSNGWNRLAVGFSLFTDAAQIKADNKAAA